VLLNGDITCGLLLAGNGGFEVILGTLWQVFQGKFSREFAFYHFEPLKGRSLKTFCNFPQTHSFFLIALSF